MGTGIRLFEGEDEEDEEDGGRSGPAFNLYVLSTASAESVAQFTQKHVFKF